MFKHILVPTDGSGFSHKAVATGARLARSLGAKLLLLHVRSPIESPHHVEGGALSIQGGNVVMHEIEDEERKLLDAALAIAAADGAKAETAFIAGYSTYDAIIRIAGLLIGSETQKVLTHTAVPVLVVR